MCSRVVPSVGFFLLLLAGSGAVARVAHAQSTLSIQEWVSAANLIEKSNASVYETRLFDTADGRVGIVVLAMRIPSWNLYILIRGIDGKIHLNWDSGPLSDTFSITDRSNLKIVSLDTRLRNLVQFKACNLKASPAACSVVLYDPVKGDSFAVTRDATNKVSYSDNLELRDNKIYRDWLDREILGPSGLSIN